MEIFLLSWYAEKGSVMAIAARHFSDQLSSLNVLVKTKPIIFNCIPCDTAFTYLLLGSHNLY